MIVAIEGCDAMGKHTQAKLLSEYLNNQTTPEPIRKARVLAFPRDDGPVGHIIRDMLAERYNLGGALPHVIQALMLADRMAAAPYLNDPDWITICDRYNYSGIVYGAADGLEEPWLHDMHKLLPEACTQILLDADPELAKARRPKMRDRYEQDFSKLHKIREKYLSIWRENGKYEIGKWYIINAADPPDIVHKAIVDAYKHSKLFRENGLVQCQTTPMYKI